MSDPQDSLTPKPKRKRSSLGKRWKRQIHKLRSNKRHYYAIAVQVISALVIGAALIFASFWIPIGRRSRPIPNIMMPEDTWALLIVLGITYTLGVFLGIFGSGYLMRLKSSRSVGFLGTAFGGFLALVIGVLLSMIAPLISFALLLILPVTLGMLDYHSFDPDDDQDDEDDRDQA